MSLIYDGVTIPNGAVITYGGTTLTKIIFNGVTVWQKATDATKNFGNHTYIDHVGTPSACDAGGQWVCDLGREGVIKSFYLGHKGGSYAPWYRLYGRRTTSDGWTALTDGITLTSARTITVSNTNLFRYLRLDASGVSYSQWEDPAGLYYWCEAYSFTVDYQY